MKIGNMMIDGDALYEALEKAAQRAEELKSYIKQLEHELSLHCQPTHNEEDGWQPCDICLEAWEEEGNEDPRRSTPF